MKKCLKTKKLLSVLLSLALLCGILPLSVFSASAAGRETSYTGYFSARTNADTLGEGTEEKPYIIRNADELFALTAEVNGNTTGLSFSGSFTESNLIQTTPAQTFANTYFKLDENFDNTTQPVTVPIAGGVTTNFSGIFDGNNRTVTLGISSNSKDVGLFGYVSYGKISNLKTTGTITLTGASPETETPSVYEVAGVCALAYPADLTNCSSDVKITLSEYFSGYYGYQYIGGICGYAYSSDDESKIKDCSFSGKIDDSSVLRDSGVCNEYIGGIAGNANAEVTNCTNTGDVVKKANSDQQSGSIAIGGICGTNSNWVKSCLNKGNVTMEGTKTEATNCLTYYIGGIAGSNAKQLANCSNEGIVSTSDYSIYGEIGGVCGTSYSADYRTPFDIINCSNKGNISAKSITGENETNIGGVVGGGYYNARDNYVQNCYNVGNIEYCSQKNLNIGGIIGYNDDYCYICNSYSAGEITDINKTPVTDDVYIGGVAGYSKDVRDASTYIYSCYYNRDLVCDAVKSEIGYTTCGYRDCQALTTEQMKSKEENGLSYLLNNYLASDDVRDHTWYSKETLDNWCIVASNNSGYPIFEYENEKLESVADLTIDLTLTQPKSGEKLATEATIDSVTSTQNVQTGATVNNIIWENENGNTVKKATCCEAYTANINVDLVSAIGYKLADNIVIEATVNGKAAEVKVNKDNTCSISYTFDKTQHVWDNGRVVERSTTTEEGTRFCTCTVCNATKTEAITKLGLATQKITVKRKYTTKTATVKIKAKAKGKLRFKALSKSKVLKVNKNGKITIKKGTKAGTYKIKVKVTAKGTKNYKKATVTKVIKVKVK